ncbi:spermidine synthase [Motilibacter sp. K478]|nr:spermidine synthase [Motilibacter aurantiacus]
MRRGGGAATVLDRRRGVSGELVLQERDGVLEIVADGTFLMDTRDGRSERLLVRAALAASAAPVERVLVGGLGVGFSLLEALGHPTVTSVVVVELEPTVVDWHAGPLRAVTAGALDDPRVAVVVADLADHLAAARAGGYDVVCIDTDNGPDWLVRPANRTIWSPHGLALARRALAPAGVLAVWSAASSASFEARLRAAGFGTVDRHEVPVDRGEPDVVWVAS